MDVLRTAISAAGVGLGVSGKPTYEQAVALTARFPTAITMFARQREGKEPVEPRADLGHAANYLYMLTGQAPEDRHTKSLDTYLVLLADHGMNASTFTARVIASTESDLASCVVGAIGALKGPLHGGAPSLVLDMLDQIGDASNIKPWVDNALDHKQKLMGFGHRVYKTTDPRAEILRDMAKQASTPEFFALARGTEEYAHRGTAPAQARPAALHQRRVLLRQRPALGWPRSATSSPPPSPPAASLGGPRTCWSNWRATG